MEKKLENTFAATAAKCFVTIQALPIMIFSKRDLPKIEMDEYG
jgi:hypothetical protein